MDKKLELETVKQSVIKSLHKYSYYNKRHTPIKNVCKRLPKIPCKKVKKAIKELKNESIITVKPTYHGADVSLNVKKKKEIDKYLSMANQYPKN